MKKKSTVFIFVLVITVLTISVINFSKNANKTITDDNNLKGIETECVSEVVSKVSNLVDINDLTSLENYVTETPESFKTKYNEFERRAMKMDMKTFQSLMEEKKAKNIITKNPYPSFSNKKDLLNYAIGVLDFVNERNLKFTEIDNIKQKDKEAKALVKFRSENSAETFEILLYQTENGWKVFSFSFPRISTELYAETENSAKK